MYFNYPLPVYYPGKLTFNFSRNRLALLVKYRRRVRWTAKDRNADVDCIVHGRIRTWKAVFGDNVITFLWILLRKKIGILINQPYCLEVVFLFALPLGILTFHRMLFQYSPIDVLYFSRNVCQSRKFTIFSIHVTFRSSWQSINMYK